MGLNQAAEAETRRSAQNPRSSVTLALCSLGFFLITLDILIVNLALTQISAELGGGPAAQQWVIDSYTLMFAALLLFSGNLSDRIGAKKAFGWGVALFLLASLACAAAPGILILIGARALQGAGASLMLPASMALIREAFPEANRRAHALGIWAVGGAVAGAVGPLLGGLLVTVNWRLVFAINLPVCLAMLVMLRVVTPSVRRPVPFDWAGQLTSVIALGALLNGLISGGSEGFGAPLAWISLVLAGIFLTAFLLLQVRVQHPMMPLELFRPVGMRISLLAGFSFMVSNFGLVFVASLFLQQHLGLPPLQAGLVFLPSSAFAILANMFSGRLTNRFSARVPVVLGLSCMGVGLVAMALTASLGQPVLVAVLMILTSSGGAMAMPQVTAVVLASVPAAQAGTASAVFNTFRQMGGAVAIAVFGALLAGAATFVQGLQLSFGIAAALLFLSVLAARKIRPAH
ncbi:MFS transporter [Psychromicrobium xiongbiense]|uniref:MFS transporter n=1 Tax=Psychromicrobium xiongbiense TaxID=3051184 RepID=UPI00255663B1|nr:MFS transporter [Psychromicrobium sp. YIM S02556]